jgi:thiamine-monophosphate kinase
MSHSEFDVIETYFAHLSDWAGDHVRIGVGDDCAQLKIGEGFELVVSTDTFVQGVHFPDGAEAELVADRTLNAAASDLAAMGAEPWAVVGALVLPSVDAAWLRAFSDRLRSELQSLNLPLVGGNLTKGPCLSITWTVMGRVKAGQSMTRGGAAVGDDLYVSGWLGRAALGLKLYLDQEVSLETESLSAAETVKLAYRSPKARLLLGQQLNGIATAGIDVSDGLLADLMHLLSMSGVGAAIALDLIAADSVIEALVASQEERLRLMLTGGDDYELCFTASVGAREALARLAHEMGLPLTRIGTVSSERGITLTGLPTGMAQADWLASPGYRHFS